MPLFLNPIQCFKVIYIPNDNIIGFYTCLCIYLYKSFIFLCVFMLLFIIFLLQFEKVHLSLQYFWQVRFSGDELPQLLFTWASFNFSFILKDNFPKYTVLFCSFRYLSISSLFLFSCKVSDISIEALLYMWSPFSLAAFKIVSLFVTLDSLTMMYVVVGLSRLF